MPDAGIKKAIFSPRDFPPLFAKDLNSPAYYILKYKIVSDDKTQVSHWSPTYLIEPPPPTTVSGKTGFIANTPVAITTASDNTNVLVSWTKPGLLSSYSKFDVFVKWSYSASPSGFDADWSLAQSSVVGSSTSIKVPSKVVNGVNTKAKWLKVWIQLETIDRTTTTQENVLISSTTIRNSYALIYQTPDTESISTSAVTAALLIIDGGGPA